MLERINALNSVLVGAYVEYDTLYLNKESEMVPESVSNPLSIEEEFDCVAKEGQSNQFDMRLCNQKCKKK